VGAVYDANYPGFDTVFCSDVPADVDRVACWSNSDPTLDLLAPGCEISSAGLSGPVSTYCGTSQASPHAAGAAALLLQQRYDATPDQIEARLKSTGVPRTDTRNGVTTPRIDLLSAVSLAAFGDVDCNFRVDAKDVTSLLKHSGGLNGSAGGSCPAIGSNVGGRIVGDVSCDNGVSPLDALKELVYYARVPQPPGTPSCPAVGEATG
jgi:subtilisin family serine protease